MLSVMNFALGLEIVLFGSILVVMRLAVSVDVLPSYSSLSPPDVTLTLCVSALFGCKLPTNRMNEVSRSFGTTVRLMKKIMLVTSGIRVPAIYANWTKLFANPHI